MSLISLTQKFKLEKNTLNTKEWGMSRFDQILELWIFILDYRRSVYSSELGFDIFLLHNNASQTETWRKDCWFLFFICSLVWFLYSAKCDSAAHFVLTSKTGRVALLLRWALFVPEIFVSPLSEFEQHTYSSNPRPDTGSLMRLESRKAVPQASQLP